MRQQTLRKILKSRHLIHLQLVAQPLNSNEVDRFRRISLYLLPHFADMSHERIFITFDNCRPKPTQELVEGGRFYFYDRIAGAVYGP